MKWWQKNLDKHSKNPDLCYANMSVTKKGKGSYLHTKPSNPWHSTWFWSTILHTDLHPHSTLGLLINPCICILQIVNTSLTATEQHWQSSNSFLPLLEHTHTDQPKNVFMLHIQIIYTPRAQAPYSSEFTKTHDFTVIVQTFSLSQDLYSSDLTRTTRRSGTH